MSRSSAPIRRMTSSMINFPTYRLSSGMTDLSSRKAILPMAIPGWVRHIMRKNGGRCRSASICSRQLVELFSIAIADAKMGIKKQTAPNIRIHVQGCFVVGCQFMLSVCDERSRSKVEAWFCGTSGTWLTSKALCSAPSRFPDSLCPSGCLYAYALSVPEMGRQ